MKTKGFTIVEILVAIAVIALLGTIMVAIFISTLQGVNKSQILSAIKQNGQAVLESLDKNIRGAESVICPAGGPSDTLVFIKNNVYTRVKIIPEISSAANGKIVRDYPAPSPGVVIPCSDLPVNEVTLTDSNPQTGVSVFGGSFTLNQQAGSKDSVTMEFSLRPGVGAQPVLRGQIDPVKFQTTIQLR